MCGGWSEAKVEGIVPVVGGIKRFRLCSEAALDLKGSAFSKAYGTSTRLAVDETLGTAKTSALGSMFATLALHFWGSVLPSHHAHVVSNSCC